MSWGPGSPLGWAGFLVGRGNGLEVLLVGEKGGGADRDQPSQNRESRQGCAREDMKPGSV